MEREQHYINLLKPEYNILKIAGSPLGYKHTEESLAKMRNRKLSKEHLDMVLTRILSDDHKVKVRKANLGQTEKLSRSDSKNEKASSCSNRGSEGQDKQKLN